MAPRGLDAAVLRLPVVVRRIADPGYSAAVTESPEPELEALDRLARIGQTLLQRSASFSTELLSPQQQLTLARFENQLNVDEADQEPRLASFLATTNGSRLPF